MEEPMPQFPATSKYDTAGFGPPLEDGEYLVSLAAVHETKRDGTPFTDKDGYQFCRFEFEVDGDDRRLFDNFTFDESSPRANQSLGKFKQLVVALGMDPERPGHTNALLGKTCIAVVKQREYKQKTYANIVEYRASDGSVPTAEDEDLPY